ncbi:DUF1765-domain-containing protein [Rhizophagus irregularis]|uniref:DUF1765-domain-containing protein n=1 Tax=Rhizophagus irregularis TaxID=588596 RepID=A0A2N1NLH7_9GLOM|nr:DUF1765-domain-containing protein [Rhizophagus irregularis]
MQNLNDNDKSLSIADNENITSNPSETIKLPEKNSTDTALNLDSDFKNIDSTEEPPIPDSSSSASYQPTSVTPPTPAMTVTTKATTTSTTTTISRLPDKKSKYGFISNLLSSNSSSNSVSTTSSGTDVSKKKSSSMDSGIRFKLFKSWNNNTQDNEYKSIEKALARFQSKDRHKVDVIKSVLIPWLKKYITINATDKGLQHGRVILLKWWNILISNLPNAAYTDRTLYFECILSLMTRNEFEFFDRIGSIPQLDTADTYMEIPINTIITYRAALMSTLHYAIDRLNQKGVYSNVISFCARVLALCFFKIPGVGFALLQALPVSKSHIKRILKETAGEEDSSPERMKEQNEKISALFPEHLKILCFLNLRSWWRQFENAKRIWGEPPIEMSGNWIRRWQSDDSELFFSFYKYYHVVLKSYLASHFTRSVKTATPPFEFITAPGYIHLASFFLLKIESLIHRNIHTITTVIQFEHPRGGGNTNSVIQGGNGISNGMNPNATAIGMGSITNTSIDGGIVANAEANGSVALGGGVTVGAIGVNSGKPKVLEMAGRRFVETMVSIVDNGFFQEMCNIWIKAVVKKTNMYDVEGVFCLLDFIDTLIIELDNRDNIISSESMISHSVSLDNTESSRFIAPNLINILDVPFYISLIKLLLEQSDHSITILRTISFIYTHFFLLTSQAAYLKQLVKEILLDEMFETLFCHWSRNVRIYYMRLLVWRLGRIGGGVGKHDDKKEEVNDSGIIIEDNEEIVIDILVALQSRLENVRQYHEFLSNYTGDMRDIEQAFKAKLAEPTVESITESTVEGNSNKADSSNNEEVQNQQIVEPRNISSSSSVLSVSTSTLSSSSPNKNRRSRLSFKEFAALQQSSGKEMSTAACFVRWIFPNGSHRSSGSHKSNQKQISSTLTTTPQIPTRIRSKAMIQPLARQYATHRHTYAGKAIVEYEAVNQEYAEWCAQIAIIEKGNLGDGNGVNNNIETNSMTVRFPGLAVEYPKYFGNGFGNSPLM